MNKLLVVAALASFSLVSCAEYQPIVDTKGVDQVKYSQDLNECKMLSSHVQDNTLRNSLIGAGVGAALGALTGDSRNTVGTAAGFGAVGGAAAGHTKQLSEKENVLVNCLYSRGYNILNAGGKFRYKSVDRNI